MLFGSPGFQSTFGVSLPPDLKNPNIYTVAVEQGGLGLPDRDYYLKDDEQLKKVRAKYEAYIAQMLELGGVPSAKAKAQKIFAFETAIAKVSWPIEKRRDMDAIYNPRTVDQLVAYAPGFDWRAFLAASELSASQGSDRRRAHGDPRHREARSAATPLDTLKDYLTFHHLNSNARVSRRSASTKRASRSTASRCAASRSSASAGSARWTR